MDIKTLYLALGLLILIVVNIVLGSLDAVFAKDFDKQKFWRGVTKGAVVMVCFCATYLVGYLNPDVIAVSVNGTEVSVLTAIMLVMLAGYYHYAKQVIEKLSKLIRGNITVEEAKLQKDQETSNISTSI